MMINEFQKLGINFLQQTVDAEMAILEQARDREIDLVKETSAYKRAQKRGDTDEMIRLEQEASKKNLKERKKQFRNSQHLAVANITIDFLQAYAKEIGKLGPIAFATTHPMLLAAQAAMIAGVYAQSPPSFASGGLIGGRRHSQGGTIIEAEQGEFVMNRNAVQSIGVNNLNAMNQGGGAVTVNITGNVMSQDFVENELSEKIQEAVRKGTEFGIG